MFQLSKDHRGHLIYELNQTFESLQMKIRIMESDESPDLKPLREIDI